MPQISLDVQKGSKKRKRNKPKQNKKGSNQKLI